MPTKALLVIDMQKDLCYDPRRKHKVEEMLPSLQRAIDLFASTGYPVFYICFSLPPDDEQFKRFGDRYCIEGTEGAAVIPELLPLRGPIIKKKKHSAFFETELEQRLKDAGVAEVYLAGMQTQICIMTTAADAHFRGYHAIAISDCVLSTRDEKKDAALEFIGDYFGDVVSLGQVAEELQSNLPSSNISGEETITLAHGDGDAVTWRFIQDEVLTRFGNPMLNPLEDGAWVTLNGLPVVVSTDSYIVEPPVFPGGDIGRLAVSGTVNDLVASGAIPHYLTLGLIVSEGFPLSTLRRILDSVRETAESAGVQIAAGDTKVLDRRVNAGICINTTGLGSPIEPGRDYAVSRACDGDRVIVTGSVGDHGLAVLSVREGLGFERRVQSDCAPLHDLIIPLLNEFREIRCLRDPTRGGLNGVLVDIAESSGVDVFVNEDEVPVKNEVRFGCEMLGLDPLHLVNEGKMVIVVAPQRVDDVVASLRQHPLGRESAAIGIVRRTSSLPGRLVLRKGHLERVVVRPEGQALPRLC